MKHTVKTLSCAILTMILLVGCSDETGMNTQPAKTSLGSEDVYYQNPNNPQDSVGYYHNALLAYFFDHGTDKNTQPDMYLSMTDQYFTTILGKPKSDMVIDAIQNIPEYETEVDHAHPISPKSFMDSLQTWHTTGRISEALLPYYKNVAEALSMIDTTDLQSGDKPVMAQIKTVENIVKQNAVLNPDQKMDFFAFSSTMRYSFHHWFTIYITDNSNVKEDGFWDDLVDVVATVGSIACADATGIVEHADDPAAFVFESTGQEELAAAYDCAWGAVYSYVSSVE